LAWLLCSLASCNLENRRLTTVSLHVKYDSFFLCYAAVHPRVSTKEMLYGFWWNFICDVIFMFMRYSLKVCELNTTLQESGLHLIFLIVIHLRGALVLASVCLHNHITPFRVWYCCKLVVWQCGLAKCGMYNTPSKHWQNKSYLRLCQLWSSESWLHVVLYVVTASDIKEQLFIKTVLCNLVSH
jgi:hypothetical protein